jgi:O-antigen/teichoic acid export membrane protein
MNTSGIVLSIPLVFISATISQVFYQQISMKKNASESIRDDVRKILMLLAGIITLEMLIILPFGPQVFGFVFGSNYELSGFFSRILIFSFATNFITSAFSSVFITLNRLKLNAIWQVLYFLAICSLAFFKNYNIEDFLKIFVLIDVTFQLIYCAMIYYLVNDYEKNIEVNVPR